MIKIENLKKTYDRGTGHASEVLHGLSFSLPDTGFVCILGPSGCGKTSLLNAIGGLDVFDSGKITSNDTCITRAASRAMEQERNASFGYIFQNYYLLAEHSVAYNVFIGMHSLPLSHREKMARVKDALARVDMLRYQKRPVGELSGGQQQRVAIARAIARRPKVIFADEPTGNLDEANTLNICSILKELSGESLVVMVTHEERIARFFADRIITLEEGRILSDTTDWDRGTVDAGAKNTLYTEDYQETKLSSEEVSLRILTEDGAPPVSLTVISEGDRIIIKVDDPRTVLCSETNSAPFLSEGARPVLAVAPMPHPTVPGASDTPKALTNNKKSSKKGLSAGMLFKEARTLVSGKKLRKFGTGVFIILLSLMLVLSISDIITIAHIDPEDFITSDSHILSFSIERGPALSDHKNQWSLRSYIREYLAFIDGASTDFDYLPGANSTMKYTDSTVPQLGTASLNLGYYSLVHLSRLDESTLILGRMPERSDEIVIDRWVLEHHLEEEGILQNIIPNIEYMLGKRLSCDKKTFSPMIVGICDSQEPAIYMSKEALLSVGTNGNEVMTLSEFKKLTGYNRIESLAADECIVISENAGGKTSLFIGASITTRSDKFLKIVDLSHGVAETHGITAKIVIADEALDPLYRAMIESSEAFELWCADKTALYERLNSELPETLHGMLDVSVIDSYENAYSVYQAEVAAKLDARTIVTVAVLLLSIVMLYLMQRSKIQERMDLIAVYRLLGIPKRNLMTVFAIESLILTFKYAVPTVLASWIVITILSGLEEISITMIYPLWAAGITLLMIAVVRLLLAVLPAARLLSYPPAKLASKYDF